MLTDSKALSDVITGSNYTIEKRPMVDLAATREAYNDRKISNIGLIRSKHNPADGFTNIWPNTALQKLLQTHTTSSDRTMCHRYVTTTRETQIVLGLLKIEIATNKYCRRTVHVL